ncbi:MAG: molybdenum cofactor biosynthesis protein MoaE [Thermodesulfobacteriota bacterium]|nr:molybdenum cofactor biosynthesis protein MoaE [Thermodesulfobacteriota bacterium]
MDLNEMIEKIKRHADSNKIGMIASHLGVVRGVSRNGEEVKGIEVKYDFDVINSIIQDIKRLPGIVEAIVDTNEGHLNVGDEIMAVVIAGDIRENVFPALMKAVACIKEDASWKKEF